MLEEEAIAIAMSSCQKRNSAVEFRLLPLTEIALATPLFDFFWDLNLFLSSLMRPWVSIQL